MSDQESDHAEAVDRHITAVVTERGSPYRAHYYVRDRVLAAGADEVQGTRADEEGWKAVRWPVMGWAAMGASLWPVRVEDKTGRGVLVGSSGDPLKEFLLGVFVAGISNEELGDAVDAQISRMGRGEEVQHAEEDED
jgi:hypothetical protein